MPDRSVRFEAVDDPPIIGNVFFGDKLASVCHVLDRVRMIIMVLLLTGLPNFRPLGDLFVGMSLVSCRRAGTGGDRSRYDISTDFQYPVQHLTTLMTDGFGHKLPVRFGSQVSVLIARFIVELLILVNDFLERWHVVSLLLTVPCM